MTVIYPPLLFLTLEKKGIGHISLKELYQAVNEYNKQLKFVQEMKMLNDAGKIELLRRPIQYLNRLTKELIEL